MRVAHHDGAAAITVGFGEVGGELVSVGGLQRRHRRILAAGIASASMQLETGTDLLRARIDGSIGRLVFNDPAKHNVLSLEMQEAIPDVLRTFEGDGAVRVVIIEGAGGRAFVAGANIAEFGERRTAASDRAD